MKPLSRLLVPIAPNPTHLRGYDLSFDSQSHACAIRANGRGKIICWGFNIYRQSDPVPTFGAVQIGAGDYHTCAADQAGHLVCWGWNNLGQCDVPPAMGPIKTTGCHAQIYETPGQGWN